MKISSPTKIENQSVVIFDKALAINPKDVGALTSKGLALSRLGMFNQSIAYFDKALAINPKYPAAVQQKQIALAACTTRIQVL